MNYKVEEIVGQRPYPGKYGDMIGYTLALVGVPEQVDISQKASTAPITAGQDIELELRKHTDEEIARFAPAATRLKGTKPAPAGGGGFGGAPRAEDPKRNAGIVRQHSQDMAIQVIRLGLEMSIIPEKPESMEALLSLVRRTADFLDADVKKVRDAA